MREYYDFIFKRKSFHLFQDTGVLSPDELEDLKTFIKAVKPLDSSIRISIEIAAERETTCKRGAEYCILFYSEARDHFLQNIGYIGEQIDLYLAAKNIGALWLGTGKPKECAENGLDFVIMLAIAKVPEKNFRRDLFKAKRKSEEEIWLGRRLEAANVVRFAPSACNTQPWVTESSGDTLSVYRYGKAGKRGIMPAGKVSYYNRIDIGIFLCFLEVCLCHGSVKFERTLYADTGGDEEKALNAVYRIQC